MVYFLWEDDGSIQFFFFFLIIWIFPIVESCRKKISSLEKDRQDLQLTINALQEGWFAYFALTRNFVF